jgi:uncharacterized protein
MEKCFVPMIKTKFFNTEMNVDLTNKDAPISTLTISKEKFYYSYSYEEDINIPYYEINVTNLCNMKCSYCFNRYSEDKKSKVPNYEISDLVSFIKERTPEKELGIKLIGGEPLLNKDWIYRFVYDLEKEGLIVHYNINTNLTLLDDTFIDFALKYKVWLLVSVDGGDDQYKGGIYKRLIFENITRLIEAGLTVTGRMVYWPNRSLSLKQLVEQCLNTGLKMLSITLPWGRSGGTEILSLLERNLQEFAEFYIDRVLNKDFRYVGVAPFSLYIRHFIFNRKFWKDNCAAGKDIYSIDINGDIYPCHCFSGISLFKSGSIHVADKINKLFYDYNVDSVSHCKECEIRYICKAKCYGDNYFTNSNILVANTFRCEAEKRIVACSAYILKKIMEEPNIYSTFRYIMGKGEHKFDNTK